MHQAWLLILGIAAVVAGTVIHVIVVTATGNDSVALVLETGFVLLVILGIGALLVRGAALWIDAAVCRR